MKIVSLPWLTYTTWIFLDVIDVVVINFLMKEMGGREVPQRTPEICMHKFCKKSWDVSKIITKIMWTKYLLKLKILGYNFKNNIRYKRIFSLWFFRFDHNLKNDDELVFLNLKINQGTKWLFPKWTYWMMKNICVVPLLFTKLVGRFDETFSFVVKPLLPYKVAFEFSP